MKLLLISYYAPPLNAIPAFRAYSLANELKVNNEVHLVTRHWEGNENEWKEMYQSNSSTPKKVTNDNLTIHYLPYIYSKSKYSWIPKLIRSPLLWIFGKYNIETDAHQFYQYISNLILNEQGNKFDFLYATSTPLNAISLVFKLSKKFNIRYLVDFRDLHNHLILNKSKTNTFKNIFELYCLKSFLKRNLKNAFLVSTASYPITNFIKSLGIDVAITVLNGYEKVIFDNLPKTSSKFFEITIIGTLYPLQNIDFLIEGFRLILEKFPEKNIKINFIGVDSIKKVATKIREKLDYPQVTITCKIDRIEALKIGKKSSVLFYSGWIGYKGVYSGKIFEYLGLKKNILIAPGDNDVIDTLIKETNSGKIANSGIEVFAILENWLEEWELKGWLEYKGTNIAAYSRENQNRKIIEKLNAKNATKKFLA